MEEDSKIIAKMLTNQVSILNKEQNDKRDMPIDEELYKGIFKLIVIQFIFSSDSFLLKLKLYAFFVIYYII